MFNLKRNIFIILLFSLIFLLSFVSLATSGPTKVSNNLIISGNSNSLKTSIDFADVFTLNDEKDQLPNFEVENTFTKNSHGIKHGIFLRNKFDTTLNFDYSLVINVPYNSVRYRGTTYEFTSKPTKLEAFYDNEEKLQTPNIFMGKENARINFKDITDLGGYALLYNDTIEFRVDDINLKENEEWKLDPTYYNQTDGIDVTAWISGGAFGLAMNKSDFWMVTSNDDVVHFSQDGLTNYSDAWSTAPAGNIDPRGLMFNGSNFWSASQGERFVYYYDITGANVSGTPYSFNLLHLMKAGEGTPNALSGNGTGMWVEDSYSFVHHINLTGGNESASPDRLNYVNAGHGNVRAIWGNATDSWHYDGADTYIYHFSGAGVNQTDGFDTNPIGMGAAVYSWAGNDSDWYLVDNDDKFIYHLRNMNYTAPIVNEPPIVNLIAPANNSQSTAVFTTFVYQVTDPDNDIVENCSLWLNQNQAGFVLDQTDYTIEQGINQTFEKSLEIANYTWKVTCYDNMSNLGASGVFNYTIYGINVPPTIDAPIIEPEQAYTDSTLNCSTTAYDVNLGSITIEFYWYNNTNIYALENITTTNGTLVSSLLTSGIQTKDETWNCTVRAFDSINYSDYKSITKTILNSIPTHSMPLLQSTTIYNSSNEDLTCYNQSTSDPDNDLVTNIYSWFVNDNSFAVLNLPFEINADDYSGNNNNGTINGTPQFITGKYGNALNFNGVDDYIEIPDSNSLDFTDKKTWELWFKRSSTGGETLFDKGNSTYSNYKLEFLDNNKLKFLYSIVPGWTSYLWQVDDETDFNQGTYNQTYYNTTYNAVMLNNYNGDYKSKIFSDSEKTLSFNTISFSADIPQFKELTVEDGMVALWHFNENSGNTTEDETVNNNDGTIYDTTWTTGKFNSALSFDGDGDYVSTSTTNFPIGNEDITVEAWFKIDNLDSDNCIITYGQALGYKAVQLTHRTSDDNLIFHYWGGYGQTTTPLNDNEWHHAVGVHTNNTNYLYLDGELKDSTSYETANIVNSFNDIGRVIGYSSYDFDGIIDEVAIWNRSLTLEEIQDHYNKGIGALTNLSLSVRSCTSNDCSDKGTGWDITDITETYDISSLTDNKYVQFKAYLKTNDTDYSPKLYNVTLNYSAQVTEDETSITSTSSITDTDWHFITMTFDNTISENNFKLYLDNSLETQKTEHSLPYYKDNDLTIAKYFNGVLDEFRIYDRALSSNELSEHFNLNYNKIKSDETSKDEVWKCEITPNDGTEDGSTLESNTILIKPGVYDITFNITEGEYGNDLTGVMISCNNNWGISSTPTNPYTTKFYEGSYECEFEKAGYYNKTKIFVADNDKQIDIKLSVEFSLTVEEHTWLEAIYNCLYEGNCKALNLLEEINETTTNIWDQFKPTDISVVLKEDIISNSLSSTQNITIDYTIKAPSKAGYSTGDYVPIRIAYWFLDENNETCQDQDKRTDSNIAETPYCIPLIAETLGKINYEVNFTVDLRPDLPSGTYTIISDIEIDPNQIWIKHSQENLGTIKVLEDNNKAFVLLTMDEIAEEVTTIAEPKEPEVKATGLKIVEPIKEKVEEIKNSLTSSHIVSIIAIICALLSIIVICFTVYKIKIKG